MISTIRSNKLSVKLTFIHVARDTKQKKEKKAKRILLYPVNHVTTGLTFPVAFCHSMETCCQQRQITVVVGNVVMQNARRGPRDCSAVTCLPT